MEVQQEMDLEMVYWKLMAQPVTLTLGEVLGSSFELGKWFLKANRTHRILVAKANVGVVELEEGESDREEGSSGEFSVASGEVGWVDMERLHEMSYQSMVEQECENHLGTMSEVGVTHPNKYWVMVTTCLNGKVHEKEYTMLLDSGSELNIMTLSQVNKLALPIDESGLSWTLRRISGHVMNLEGVCWDVPVKIGGLTFTHNFFISCEGLGNKDMVLGQPWLFSQSARIKYLHELGMKIQPWEQGQRDGRSILINLPLVNAPRNVMPTRFEHNHLFQSRSGE